MEREITLRDYARILWSGRWLVLGAALLAALVGLLLSATKAQTYTAQSVVYMGLATTAATGQAVPTPTTTPITAQKAIRGDNYVQEVAEATGVDFDRVRDGITPLVERIPGAVGGNLPTVATLRYVDRDRASAVTVANAYADSVFNFANERYLAVEQGYATLVDNAQRRITEIQGALTRERNRDAGANQATLVSLQQELATMQLAVDDNTVRLAKTKQIEQPYIVSQARSAVPARTSAGIVRSTIFGAIVGLLIGALAVFIWKGSPTERAAT